MYEIHSPTFIKDKMKTTAASRSPGRIINTGINARHSNGSDVNAARSTAMPKQGRRFKNAMNDMLNDNQNVSSNSCGSMLSSLSNSVKGRRRLFLLALILMSPFVLINGYGLLFAMNHKRKGESKQQQQHSRNEDGDIDVGYAEEHSERSLNPLTYLSTSLGFAGTENEEREIKDTMVEQSMGDSDNEEGDVDDGDDRSIKNAQHNNHDNKDEEEEEDDEDSNITESNEEVESLKEAMNIGTSNDQMDQLKESDNGDGNDNNINSKNDNEEEDDNSNKIPVTLAVGVARNGCPFGFVSLPNNESPRCFYLGLEPETHTQSEVECAKFGGHLATVLTKKENDLLCTMMSIADNRHARLDMAHIGLKRGDPTKSNSAGEFTTWEDGTPYDHSHSKSYWVTGEPDGRGYKYSSKESSISKYLKGTYGIIHCRKEGKWIDWSSLKLPYFCSIPKPKRDPSQKKFIDRDGIYGKEAPPPSYWHPTPSLPSKKCSWKPIHHGNILLSTLNRQYPWKTGRRKKGSQRRYYAVWQTKHYFGYQRYWVGYLEDEQTFHPVPVGELWRGSFGASTANAAQRHTGYFHTPAVLTKYRPRAVFSRLPIPASILVHLDEGALINQLYTVERAPLGDKQLLHLALTEYSKKCGCNLEEAGIYPLSFDMSDRKQCLAFVQHVSITNSRPDEEAQTEEEKEQFEKSIAFEEAAQEELTKFNRAEDETEEDDENDSTKKTVTQRAERDESDDDSEQNAVSDSDFTKTAWLVKGSAHGGLAVHVMRASKVVARYGMDCSKPRNETVQRYISNPLLLDDRKFDVRAFMLVARGAALKFTDPTSTKNKGRHVTNSHIQQKSIMTKEDWENHIWNPARVARYAEKAGIPSDFASRIMIPRIKTTLQFVLSAIVDSLTDRRPGQWKLFGVDFVVDKNMHPWLIDVNGFPGFGWTFQTPWALGYRKKMLKSMWETVFDVQIGSGNSDPSQKIPRSGGFELIYHGRMPPDDISR